MNLGKLLNSTAFSSPRMGPKIPEFMHVGKRVAIRQDVDRLFRNRLVELARAASASIEYDVRTVLQRGPSKGGARAAQQKYGDDLHPLLLRTVPLVEYLERQQPGFKKWLELTGFGNDADMIRVFVEWANLGWNRHVV